jgi:hypothetical protein
MWGSVRPKFIHLAPLDRVRLRRIAVRYAAHGWEVTPGACLAQQRFVCGRAGCPTKGCHPALEDWEQAATTDPARIANWWQHRPHALLLATGRAFDVIEVPAYLGRHVLDAIRPDPRPTGPARSVRDGRSHGRGRGRSRAPVAVTPAGRWMFLVRPGDPLRPELDQCLYVVRHGLGSWIPAPPTRLPEGPVRWAVSPEETRWQLPESYAMQGLLIDALRALSPGLPSSVLPGQLPLPRRGF